VAGAAGPPPLEAVAKFPGARPAGPRGYVRKSMPRRARGGVARRVHAGKKQFPADVAARLAEHVTDEALTEREKDVLMRIAEGYRNREIADLLSITEETVKAHIKHILEKLGAGDRTSAVATAVRRGIIQV